MKNFLTIALVLLAWLGPAQSGFKAVKAGAKLSGDQTIIQHTYYTIGYFEKYRIPLWTYNVQTKARMLKCLLDREGDFEADPETDLVQADKDDYASPFQRGHAVPCEPMTFSKEAMAETFYYTNCSPQYAKVNTGRWRTLEKLVNNWTIDHLELRVVTGNTVSKNSLVIGAHEVYIPDYCYKIVLDYKGPEIKALAFYIPNKNETLHPLENYLITIDRLEQLTGLDFFADLPKTKQAEFEASFDASKWDWKVGKYDALFKKLKKEAGMEE